MPSKSEPCKAGNKDSEPACPPGEAAVNRAAEHLLQILEAAGAFPDSRSEPTVEERKKVMLALVEACRTDENTHQALLKLCGAARKSRAHRTVGSSHPTA